MSRAPRTVARRLPLTVTVAATSGSSDGRARRMRKWHRLMHAFADGRTAAASVIRTEEETVISPRAHECRRARRVPAAVGRRHHRGRWARWKGGRDDRLRLALRAHLPLRKALFDCNVVPVELSRPYVKQTRQAAQDETKERILVAGQELFTAGWYDEVTLRAVAASAGVALQTVVNHFGTKANLAASLVERVGGRIDSRRDAVLAGDAGGAVAVLVDEYERVGDAIVRMLALEQRVDEMTELLSLGRRVHRAWVERVFADALRGSRGAERTRRTAMLVAATDVLTWKLLRRDQGLSRRATQEAMVEMVQLLTTAAGSAR